MAYFVKPRKPRTPSYMKKPLFCVTRELPQALLFTDPNMPDSPLLKLIHQVQNEIYNCTKLFNSLLLLNEEEIQQHFLHRAYEYCRQRKFKFEILANADGFTLEFSHHEVPGKIVVFMGSFDSKGISPDFIRLFAEKIFHLKEIISLRRKEKR